MRYLIEQTVQSDHDWIESLPEVTAPVPDAKKSGGMVITPTKHRHRFIKGEDVAGYAMKGRIKVPVYLYSCECGETEVR